MKRTIASARLTLEEDFSRQPSWWQAKAQEALKEAEKAATAYANDYISNAEPELREAIDEPPRS